MLSNVVDNDVAKKFVFNELLTKFNAIKIRSTSGLISKIQHKHGKQKLEKKIKDVDKKISNTSILVKKTSKLNARYFASGYQSCLEYNSFKN